MKKIIILLTLLSVINLYVFSDIYEASIYKLKSGDVTIENARITDDYVEFILKTWYDKGRIGHLKGVYTYKGAKKTTNKITILQNTDDFRVRWNYKEDVVKKEQLSEIDFTFDEGQVIYSNRKITDGLSEGISLLNYNINSNYNIFVDNTLILESSNYMLPSGKYTISAEMKGMEKYKTKLKIIDNKILDINEIVLKYSISDITLKSPYKHSSNNECLNMLRGLGIFALMSLPFILFLTFVDMKNFENFSPLMMSIYWISFISAVSGFGVGVFYVIKNEDSHVVKNEQLLEKMKKQYINKNKSKTPKIEVIETGEI